MKKFILLLSLIVFLIYGKSYAQYCAATATNLTDEYLTNVTFADINNNSGSTGYSDFTDMSTNVDLGATYTFSSTVYINGSWSEHTVVWIDWNQNMTFEDNERYVIGNCNSDGCTVSNSITVPTDATIGTTRMRVMMRFSTIPTNPCGSYTYGEVEDYTVVVVGSGCLPPSQLSATDITINSASLNWNENGSASIWQVQYGMLPFTLGSGTTVDVSSKPFLLENLTPGKQYGFYTRAICGDADASNWSAMKTFTTLETCPTPSGVAVTNITSTSAQVDWTENGQATAWIVVYGESPLTNINDGIAEIALTKPYTLANLDPLTTYDCYVIATCALPDMSNPGGPATFTTTIQADVVIGDGNLTTLNLPINPNYGYNYSQTIYYQSEINQSNKEITSIYYYWNGASSAPNSKDWTIFMGHTSKTAFTGTNDWVPMSELTQVFSGEVTLPATAGWIEIPLNTVFPYNNIDNLVIAVDENTSNYDSYSAKFLGTSTPAYRGILYRSDSNNPDPNEPPVATSQVSGFANIALMLQDGAGCYKPTQLTTLNITSNSAELDWTETGTATSWEVKTTIAGNEIIIPVSSKPFLLENLQADYQYTFYVRSVCGNNEFSQWAGPKLFRTLEICPKPTNIIVTDITATTATLSWEQAGSPLGWAIVYGPSPLLSLQDGTTIQTSTQPFTIQNLNPLTKYDCYVVAACDLTTISNPAGPVTFTTSIQADVVIGNGVITSLNLPINPNWGYNYSQTIYLQNEINLSNKEITKVYYYWNGLTAAPNSALWSVFMGHTTKSAFENTTDWVPFSELSQVFTGDVNLPATPGWIEIILNTPFAYNNIDNLVIAVHEETPNFDGSTCKFLGTSTTTNRGILYRSDSSNPNPQEPPTASSVLLGYGNIALIVQDGNACFKPTGLTANNITYNSAQLNWTEAGNATAWEVKTNIFGVDDIFPVDSKPYQVVDLVPETQYYYYVRSVCDVDVYSDWAGPFYYTTLPTCIAPINPEVISVTTNTATVNWIEQGTATTWNIQYGLAGFEIGQGTILQNITNTPTLISGLNAGLNYQFYVQSVCSEQDFSSWTGPVAFTTQCETFQLPYIEDFETNSINCWATVNNDGGGQIWALSTAKNHTPNGVNSAFHSWGAQNYDENGDAITPLIQLTENANIQLSFWSWNTYSADYGKNSVLISTDQGQNFTEIWTTSSVVDNWAETVVDLSDYAGQSVKLAFKYEGTFAHGWYIDDIQVIEISNCPIPENLAADNITTTTADISWTVQGTAQEWAVQYGATPYVLGQSNPFTVTETNSSLTNLSPSTEYAYYVRSLCANDEVSNWAGPFIFTTSEPCTIPMSFNVMDITQTSATFNWLTSGSETSWNIEYGVYGFQQGGGTLINVTENPYTLTDLSQGLYYQAYIQSVCDAGNSSWVGPVNFVLPCDPFQLPYTEDFETGADCWTGYDADGGGQYWNIGFENHTSNGQYSLYHNYGAMNYQEDGYLISPQIILPDQGPVELSFWSLNIYSPDYGKNSVLVSTDGFMYDEIWSPETVSSDWTETKLNLDNYLGQTVQIAFRYEGTYAHGWYVDDISVNIAEECPEVTCIQSFDVCENANPILLTGATPEGGVYSGDGVENGYFNPSLAGGSGPHTILYTYTNGNCQNSCDFIITVNPTYTDAISASICQGQEYQFGSQILTEEGEYDEVFTTQTGCDSVVTLNLTVFPSYDITIDESICDGETYYFGNIPLIYEGTYYQTFAAFHGCDSMVTLNLTVNPIYNVEFEANICNGSVYDFYGQELTESGHYFYYGATQLGCDSTVILWLNVTDAYTEDIYANICEGQNYNFYGDELAETGEYVHTITTPGVCDSVYTLHLTVNPVFNVDLYEQSCGDYLFEPTGTQYGESGDYVFNFETINGCDSIVTLHLTINPEYNENLYATICEGSEYIFNGQAYTQTGSYPFAFATENGCDSLITLWLDVVEAYTDDIYASICEGVTYDFFGTMLEETGDYIHTIVTPGACDSVYTLHLTVNPTYDEHIYEQSCGMFYFDASGDYFTESGDYIFNNQTISGCDSIVTLHLTVNPEYNENLYATICEGSEYIFNGQAYTQTGSYPFAFATENGCDSLITLWLDVVEAYTDDIYASICEMQSYPFFGVDYYDAGEYTHTITTPGSCDSIFTLHLTVNPIQYDVIQANVCEGNVYEFNGEELTETGIYYQYTQTQFGCDYTIELQLTQRPSFMQHLEATICEGQEYEFNGEMLTEAGDYYINGQTQFGCDSIIHLMLHVNPTYFEIVNAEICNGEVYEFDANNSYTEEGQYIINYNSSLGCDSIFEVNLTVFPLPQVTCPQSITVDLYEQPFVLIANPTTGVFSGSNAIINGMFNPLLAGVGEHELLYTYQDPVTGCVNTCGFSVTVTYTPSSSADILSFTLPEQTGPAIINTANKTVQATILFGTSLTALTPQISISPLASITPNSGITQDFTAPFIYTVTAEDGTEVNWTIEVVVEPFYITATQNTGTSALLKWPVVPNAVYYIAQFRPAGTNNIWSHAGSYTNSRRALNLIPGTTYESRVLAYNAANQLMHVYTTYYFTANVISLTASENMGTAALLSWNAIEGFSSYALQFRLTGQGPWQTAIQTSTNSFRLFGLIPASEYECRILCYENGTYIAYVIEQNFMTANIQFNVSPITSSNATISWNTVPGANRYVLHYRLANTNDIWSHIHTTNTSAVLFNLTPNTSYEYRLLGYFNDVYGGATYINTFTTENGKSADNETIIPEIGTDIEIYPNPFTDNLNIEFFNTSSVSKVEFTLTDVTGRVILRTEYPVSNESNTISVDVKNIPTGIYFANLRNDNELKSFKVIKE